MRVALVVSAVTALGACDGTPALVASEPVPRSGHQPTTAKSELDPVPAAPVQEVTFAPPISFGDVDCFAVVELEDAQLALVIGDHGASAELVSVQGEEVARESLGPLTAEAADVPSCALSVDPKGQLEVIASVVTGDRRETIHLRHEGSRWLATPVARFAATQIAFNARSPRGSEVVLIGTSGRALHAFFHGGTWEPRPLPVPALTDPKARAVAITIDEEGRSHFALGTDYYGDRGDHYAFWPGDRAVGTRLGGALAIVIDPADPARHPQIVYAAGAPSSASSQLYRTVIGPDSASTTAWARVAEITGSRQELAPFPGQLAARIDADGYLHTVSATLHLRSHQSTWSLRYTHDRGGEPRFVEHPEIRATGGVAFFGDRGVLADDHGELLVSERTSSFAAAEPAEILSPPSVGQVDDCRGSHDGSAPPTLLRSMPELSAVALTSAPGDDGAVHALEWDSGRMSVRHTTGDPIGWSTTDVTDWQLDTMRAGRSTIAIGPRGAAHLAWPEGDRVVHRTNRSGEWVKTSLLIRDVIGAPIMATFGSELWLGAIDGGTGRLVTGRLEDDAWEIAPLPSDDGAELLAFDLVTGAETPTLLVLERGEGSARRLSTIRWTPSGWTRSVLRDELRDLQTFRAAADGEDLVVIGIFDDGAAEPEARDRFISVARIAPDKAIDELVKERLAADGGTRALDAVPLAGGGVMVVWSTARAVHGARITDDGLGARETLAVSNGAILHTGFATVGGRLVLVEQRPGAVAMIGQACAP